MMDRERVRRLEEHYGDTQGPPGPRGGQGKTIHRNGRNYAAALMFETFRELAQDLGMCEACLALVPDPLDEDGDLWKGLT